jgi:sugar lactone lactonase YvrE
MMPRYSELSYANMKIDLESVMLRKILVFVFVLLCVPVLALAQEDLTQTYTSDDGSLTLRYPAGWTAAGFGPVIIAANDESLLDAPGFDNIPSGSVFAFVTFGPWNEINESNEIQPGSSAMEVVELFINDPDAPELLFGPEPLFSDMDGAYAIGTQNGTDLLVAILVIDDTSGIFMIGGTAAGEMDTQRDTFIAMANSITAEGSGGGEAVAADSAPSIGPGAAPTTDATVVWHTQQPWSFEGFGSLGPVAVAADGTIYVADGSNGVHMLDASGNVTGTISSDNLGDIIDIAIAPDGTLWGADRNAGLIFSFDATGAMLSSFGQRGDGPGQFSGQSPEFFDIGPDGSIYVFDAPGGVGRFQVFDTQGNLLNEIPTDPNGLDRMSLSVNFAIGPDGAIFASDVIGGIMVYAPGGELAIEVFGAPDLEFVRPNGIDVASNGNVYVVSGEGLRVVNLLGEPITQFGMRQPLTTDGSAMPPQMPGEFSQVGGIGVAPNGDAIIADTNSAHSQVIRISVGGGSAAPETASADAATQGEPTPTATGDAPVVVPTMATEEPIAVPTQAPADAPAASGPPPVTGTAPVVWQQIREIGTAEGMFGGLGSLAVGPDDTIYVADGFNGIRVLDGDGNVTGLLDPEGVTAVEGVAMGADGTLWAINSFDGLVYNFSTDGTLITEFGGKGPGPGEFGNFSPTSFDVGPDGNLYVFDSQQGDSGEVGRIQVFDAQGNFLSEFPTDPNGEGVREGGVNIAVSPDGRIFVADFFGPTAIFDAQGNLTGDAILEDTLDFSSAQDIAFSSDGSVYVATNSGLYVLDSTLAVTAQFGARQDTSDTPPMAPGEFIKVEGIGVTSDGDVVIADSNSSYSQVIRITPSAIPSGTETAAAGDTTAASGDTGGGSLADALQNSDELPGADAPGSIRQWATTIFATSEYTDFDWNAMQASGAPDTLDCGDYVTAWASAEPGTQDLVTAIYAQPVIPTQVNVYITYNPGSIQSVTLVPTDGSLPIEIPNSNNPIGNTPCPGVFTVNITGVTAPVNGVILYLDQGPVDHWTEIDAIELVGNAP